MSKKRKLEEATAGELPPAPLHYLSGFGSHHESEAIKGALPIGRNNPQKVVMHVSRT
jgi:hypothetical protein